MYPADADRPLPVVVFVHGYLSNRDGGRYLARHLARQGYVVIAADHPHSSLRAEGRPDILDVVNQPGDVSALIDRVAALGQPGAPLAGVVDLARVGVVGHSLGGLTAVLVGFHPRLQDPRIRAAVSIAGPTALFTPDFFATRDIPFLMIAGTADVIIDYRTNAMPVLDLVRGGRLVSIQAGSHNGFDDSMSGMWRLLANPDDLGCAALGWYLEPSRARALVELLGGAKAGITLPATVAWPCDVAPPWGALDPLRQQMITQLAVAAFLESVFAPDAGSRRRAELYLMEGLRADFPEVDYRSQPAVK